MRQFLKISIIVLPCICSIAITRLIIVNGLELWLWINDTAAESFSINLIPWELDHAAFGFSFGMPMLLFTLFLLSIRYYTLARMFISSLVFYFIQVLAFLIITYTSVELFPMPFSDKTAVYFPDNWFVNSALIMASFISCAIVLGGLFILKFRKRHFDSKTIDQNPN